MAALENWGRRSMPKVEITLKDQSPLRINSYTTLDAIEGTATFTVEADTPFDQISIIFLGTSRVLIERAGTATASVGRSSAVHTFLRLTQPIDPADIPEPRILRAGRPYTFPFTFVVPEHLLPNSCSHPTNHPCVIANHLTIPPSLGDPMLAGNGVTLLDDMSPDMSRIEYAIRAKLSDIGPDGSPRTLIDKPKKVRIIPATDDEPPLSIDDQSTLYSLRKEKTVKRGTLRGKLGRIAIAAAQPKPLRLSPLYVHRDQNQDQAGDQSTQGDDSPSTMARVHVRFDPAKEDQKPPRLGQLWAKLKVDTYFASEPWRDVPTRQACPSWSAKHGVYSETVSLASRCMASVTWTKHTPSSSASPPPHSELFPPSGSSSRSSSTSDLGRRGSVQSTTSSIDSSYTGPTAAYHGATYYTTTLLVPITLPTKKAFLPTFHSCLISRTYTLDLCLSYHPPNAKFVVPNLGLRIPLQLAGPESLAEAVAERAANVQDTDMYLTPRTISPPRVEYSEQAQPLLFMNRAPSISDMFVPDDEFEAPPPEYSLMNLGSPLLAANRIVSLPG
ncbi:hypothetical protein FQN57_001213 [Myotisia sp. PD_48]|nr:hypothetical protein FQN57_001213 [Myotisia sp. PD_48]